MIELQKFIPEIKAQPNINAKELFKDLLQNHWELLYNVINYESYDDYINEYYGEADLEDSKNITDIKLIKEYFTYIKGKIKWIDSDYDGMVNSETTDGFKNLEAGLGYDRDQYYIILHNFGDLSV